MFFEEIAHTCLSQEYLTKVSIIDKGSIIACSLPTFEQHIKYIILFDIQTVQKFVGVRISLTEDDFEFHPDKKGFKMLND